MPKQRSHVWEIAGYDSTTTIFRTTIPTGTITNNQLHALLSALVAKHGLTDEELVRCFLKRGTKSHLEHLDIKQETNYEKRKTSYSCGTNPFFVARLIEVAV